MYDPFEPVVRETASKPILPRLASVILERALRVSPVVVVMGARQTGKSTLVRSHPALKAHTYLSFDDFRVQEKARRDPRLLLESSPYLILDEVQREPDLLRTIKILVDEDQQRIPGRFVLTGSANLLLMERISESLAGRATYVDLRPMTRRELQGSGRAGIWSAFFTEDADRWTGIIQDQSAPRSDWRDECRRGGFPVPAYMLADDTERILWFDGYIRTYLERDLNDLSAIDKLLDFRRLMQAAALRRGAMLHQTNLSRQTGIPRPTVHRYLNLIEASCQLVRLQPYTVNRTKRLVKTPKIYWNDSGLALALAEQTDPGGPDLENMILNDLLAWSASEIPGPQILYWRTDTGNEVDFVIEWGGQLLPVEIKTGMRPGSGDARHLRVFLEEYAPETPGALLLYDGDEVIRLAERIIAAPWWKII